MPSRAPVVPRPARALFDEFADAAHGLHAIEPSDPGLGPKALDRLLRFAGADRGILLHADEETGVHHLSASVGLGAAELQAYLEDPVVQLGLSADGCASVVQAHPLLSRAFPARGSLWVALDEGGQHLGLVLLRAAALSAGRKRAAQLLARQSALVLRNGQLVRALNERNRQLASATASLLQSEKLALTGKMAATVAHQVRNPLSVIGAHVQLMLGQRAMEDPDHEVLQKILEKVRETNATVHQLMEIGQPLLLELRRADLGPSLRTVTGFLQSRCAAQGIELRTAIQPSLPEVWLDPSLLERSLLDLCLNAVDAMPGGGRLVIAAVGFGTRVELRVEDSGPGISPERKESLFEPFQTDKVKGHGLGLFNLKRACDAMGVEISVEDAEPQGASFRLSFPVSRHQPRPILDSVQWEPPRGNGFRAMGDPV